MKGDAIWIAPGLDHGLATIVTVGEVDVMKEELVVVIVLLDLALVVFVEEMEIDEVIGREKSNEKWINQDVCEWENEVMSLVDVWEYDVPVFIRWDWSGKIPSFALQDRVKTLVPWKIEVILPLETSSDSGFSTKMETSSNFLIKDVIFGDSRV